MSNAVQVPGSLHHLKYILHPDVSCLFAGNCWLQLGSVIWKIFQQRKQFPSLISLFGFRIKKQRIYCIKLETKSVFDWQRPTNWTNVKDAGHFLVQVLGEEAAIPYHLLCWLIYCQNIVLLLIREKRHHTLSPNSQLSASSSCWRWHVFFQKLSPWNTHRHKRSKPRTAHKKLKVTGQSCYWMHLGKKRA